MTAERVLVVHAHPDDETLFSGGTIARLCAEGNDVFVVTCTRGEQGEVIPPEWHHLEGSPQLAGHRQGELASALAELGGPKQVFLGTSPARAAGLPERRYEDSGMRWVADGRAEALESIEQTSLSAAPLDEAVADLSAAIEWFDPTAVVSYDAGGGYGHPDHRRAHEIAAAAASLSGRPFFIILPDEAPPEPDDILVDVLEYQDRVAAALRCHRSQVTVTADGYALSSGPVKPIPTQERFRRIRGARPVSDFRSQPAGLRAATYAVTGVTGALVGAVTTVTHQISVPLGGVMVPLGLAGALLAVTAFAAGVRGVFASRAAAAFASLGVLIAVGVLAQKSAGGSVLVPANVLGYAWSVAAPLAVSVVAVWPRLPQRIRPSQKDSAKLSPSALVEGKSS